MKRGETDIQAPVPSTATRVVAEGGAAPSRGWHETVPERGRKLSPPPPPGPKDSWFEALLRKPMTDPGELRRQYAVAEARGNDLARLAEEQRRVRDELSRMPQPSQHAGRASEHDEGPASSRRARPRVDAPTPRSRSYRVALSALALAVAMASGALIAIVLGSRPPSSGPSSASVRAAPSGQPTAARSNDEGATSLPNGAPAVSATTAFETPMPAESVGPQKAVAAPPSLPAAARTAQRPATFPGSRNIMEEP